MHIFVCQITPKIADLPYNFRLIEDSYKKALKEKADICLLPELVTCGYMAQDLLLRSSFIDDIKKYIEDVINITEETSLILPTPWEENGNLYNACLAIQNKQIIGITYKEHLPNYGVFDEHRYFTPGNANIIEIKGTKIGIPICEDIWHKKTCAKLAKLGAELFLVPNASPFEKNKLTSRIDAVKKRYTETSIPLIYCNQVLAHDGVIFDGNSFCFDGSLQIFANNMQEDYCSVEANGKKLTPQKICEHKDNEFENIHEAIIFGLKEYVTNNGFGKVILGLSGGIDSAIVLYFAAKSMGAENVHAYMMPSKFNSDSSMEDALQLADNLGIETTTINIQQLIDATSITIDLQEGEIAHQNIQSRLRGCILMTESNKNNALLLTTGNKSEYATGYATIYGDMNGAFNPIKDLYKTEIYELAKYINTQNVHNHAEIIPANIINKEPSAELAPEQKDSDSLPDYQVLDSILFDHIENNMGNKELSEIHGAKLSARIVKLVKNSEFKRKQSAPGVKLSRMSFDKDRRFPITSGC